MSHSTNALHPLSPTLASHCSLPGQTVTYKRFHVDRPFFFTLQDNRDGTILFMGIVNKL